MIRSKLAVVLIAGMGAAAAYPATAQFGSIFGEPPRPPSNVPNRPAAPPPGPPPGVPPDVRRSPDVEPERLLPPGPPPSARIQSQPLAPPPGVTAVEPDPRTPAQPPGQPQPGQAQTGPGALPPGQRPPRGTPQPANVAPQPGDEVVTEAPTVKITNPTAVFAGLDKITGRIISFDVATNETVQFGALQVTPRACYTRPPTETQNIDGFVEVDEVTLQGEIKRLFTGWMFAASPGLHGVEHAIYDVWLTNCKGGTTTVAGPPPTAQQPAPPRTAPASATPAQRPARPAQPQPQQQLQPLPPPGVQQRPAPPPPRRDF
jgi:hypothetical protein